jgi:hypothetical protein
MRRIEHAKTRIPRRIQRLRHVWNAAICFGHGFQAVPDLAALGHEIVERIDYHQPGEVLVVLQSTTVMRGLRFSTTYVASSAL